MKTFHKWILHFIRYLKTFNMNILKLKTRMHAHKFLNTFNVFLIGLKPLGTSTIINLCIFVLLIIIHLYSKMELFRMFLMKSLMLNVINSYILMKLLNLHLLNTEHHAHVNHLLLNRLRILKLLLTLLRNKHVLKN